jgi:putative RNA 2'-phosphotransferase
MDYATLSRLVSHALRHEPDVYDLELDPEGWAEVNALLKALKRQYSELANLTEVDLRTMIQRSAKQRHEIVGARIRALYGHSIPSVITKEAKKPPKFLYHGTDTRTADKILSE